MKAKEIGAKVGKAVARDVLGCSDLPRHWTGLDPQDGDQLTAAGIEPGTPEWEEADAAAEAAYYAALRQAINFDFPVLRLQSTNGKDPIPLRNATAEELDASRAASPEGYINVDGATCFVEE
jgi:hypothetical protein